MASVKCGVTAQAVIHHYHRSETGITIINVKLRWTLSTLNINEISQIKKQNLPYITQIDRVKWKMRRVWGIHLGNGRPTLLVWEFITFRSAHGRGRRARRLGSCLFRRRQ